MGEKSKSSGELGENYVANFLKLIGWNNTQSNESITCCESEKHNTNDSKDGRKTHGIDELYTYESPMDSNTLTHAVISVKHTDNKYPTSPNSKFKEYVTDLANAIECFKESELIIQNRENRERYNEEVIGILIWLSSEDDRKTSLIDKLNNPVLKEDLLYERIHILDNDRIEFITKSINLIKEKFNQYKYSFYYIDTPNNQADSNKTYNGNILPIEMLSSDIQVFKLEKEKEIILAIVIKDEFNKDSLKRILGLAHRISNNLTSNVQILFPSFEHAKQENINIVSAVKNQFKEKEFFKMVDITGYDIGFKDISSNGNINISSIIPNEKIDEPLIDTGLILPYGEHLRGLLQNSLITESQLRTLLREKGIYFCESIKEKMVPVLSSLLLSPKEFDLLKEHQKTKEDKEKRHESRFKTESEVTTQNLKQVLKSFNLNDLDTSKFKNYKYKTPHVTFEENKEKNQLLVTYEIERYQRNKSFSEQVEFYKGTVILDCNGNNLEIITKSISTAKETLDINRNIINHIKSTLIKNNILSQTTKEEKILMSDMSNEEIIQFLLAFTDNTKLKNIKFENVKSIDMEIDESIPLPEKSDIKWMESKINKLKLDGKKIEEIKLLTENTNHKYLKCWGLVAVFKYDNTIGKGNSIVEFRFNATNKNEFFIQINSSKFDKKLYTEK
ncbi:MAG: hypothetical protein PHS65_09790, partial [Arcobacteraceae bacterium]|nr:hypothetical protein [Arcobacteraceae bacterium]